MSKNKIDCSLDNGGYGDARVSLVVAPYPSDGQMMAALDTNAGLFWINTESGYGTSKVMSLYDACRELNCTYEQLRLAVKFSYKKAHDWDWLSEQGYEDLC